MELIHADEAAKQSKIRKVVCQEEMIIKEREKLTEKINEIISYGGEMTSIQYGISEINIKWLKDFGYTVFEQISTNLSYPVACVIAWGDGVEIAKKENERLIKDKLIKNGTT